MPIMPTSPLNEQEEHPFVTVIESGGQVIVRTDTSLRPLADVLGPSELERLMRFRKGSATKGTVLGNRENEKGRKWLNKANSDHWNCDQTAHIPVSSSSSANRRVPSCSQLQNTPLPLTPSLS